jgi:hypothetical protein
MKIYFTGSLHNPNIHQDLYVGILDLLKKMDCNVDSFALKRNQKEAYSWTAKERVEYYSELKKRIGKADVVMAEVSFPSTINIGHEVSLALDLGKPTIAIYQKGREPGILQGIHTEKFLLLEYENDDLESVLEYGIEEAQQRMDVRFNFFISPQIGNYLDVVSKKKKLPRAVYLRRLIEEDMKKNQEYNN